ncbi:MAG: pyridoxal phosphate-dependent aminotransferase [Firmicutes bacterium]|nr:pyridoxal phosphate-dependent aminotransferase [Bacillota bacterium]
MNFLSQKAKNIAPSLTLAITAKANALKKEGKDIVSFTAGEPDFNTPDFVIEAAKKALDSGYTKYTPVSGILPLREAICASLKHKHNLEYAPNQIVVSCGAKHSLYNAFLALLDEGDEVLIISPYWLSYPEMVTLAGGMPKIITTTKEDNYKLTPAILEKSITKKTKVIVLNNPSNPSGIVYSKAEFMALASIIEKAGIFVISDEIYDELIYTGEKPYSLASYSDKLKDKTIVINGVSKAYAMTGWRIGYTASNVELATSMDNIQSQTTSNANSIAQYASVTALTPSEKADNFLSELKNIFQKRKNLICELLDEIPSLPYIKPNGAFYVMVDVSRFFGKILHNKKINSASDFSELLVEKSLVVTIPTESFGANDFIRLSYAIAEEDMIKGIERIKKFIL